MWDYALAIIYIGPGEAEPALTTLEPAIQQRLKSSDA
jgi:hypothetical protein